MKSFRRTTTWLVIAAFAAVAVLAVATPATGAAAEEKAAKVNLNSASAEELTTLPGIGPAYARRIIEYREKNGPFKRVEDLLNVQGIGDKTLERIRDKVSVSSGK
jgi:competence protein ComEA